MSYLEWHIFWTVKKVVFISTVTHVALEIQNFTNSNRRRSVRTATKGIFYGSPSERPEGLDENGGQEETQEPRHPLLGLARKMDPVRQLQHNQTILNLINFGTFKHLQVS